MKKVISIIAASLILAAGSVKAAETAEFLQQGYVICDSKQAFDLFVKADVDNDARMLNLLEKKGHCALISNAGVPFSILDRDWGAVKVRVWYGDDNYIDAWTYAEATQERSK